MFETKKHIRRMINRLYQEGLKLNEGDIFTREAIKLILLCEPNTAHWQHCVDAFRDRLERPAPKGRGITIVCVKTVGYRLLTASEALVVVPEIRDKKKLSQDRRLVKTMSRIRTTGLSDHEKRLRVFVIEQAKRRRSELRRHMKDREELLRPTQVNPRRPYPAQQPQARAAGA